MREISDPVLEDTFAELVDGIVNNPGQIPDIIKDKLSGLEEILTQWSFDKIGGPGTLRGIWAKLKELQKVAGVKRKLTDRDYSGTSSENSQPSWAEPGPLYEHRENGTRSLSSMPSLASTEEESEIYSDSDYEQEVNFADSVLNDSSYVSVSSREVTNSSNNISLLRGSLQQLGMNSSPGGEVNDGVAGIEGTAPIPAPTSEYYVDDGWMVGQDLESYNAWIENNQLAIESETANNNEEDH